MNNIIRWNNYKDRIFGFRAIIIDLIFYIAVITISGCTGYTKVGIGLVGLMVFADLIISYFKGKQLSEVEG